MLMSRLYPRSTVLSGLGAAVAGAAFPRSARAQTTTLHIAGVFSDLFAQPFYAKDAGAFAKAGFNVDAISMANAGAVAAAIGGGSLQMGTGDLVSGINAINAGVPIVLIAGGGLYNERTDSGSTILAVAADSPIKTPKDLIGKSIGVPTLVGLTTACLRAWLPAHGVPESSVKLIEIPQSAALPALQRGTMDAGLLSEPFVTFGKGLVRSAGAPFDIAADLSPTKQFCVSVGMRRSRGSKPTRRAPKRRLRQSTIPRAGRTRTATTRSGSSFVTASWMPTRQKACSARRTRRR